MLFWLMLLAVCASADEPLPARRDVVVVTGTYEPVPLDEADRAVRALPVGPEQRLLAGSVADFLRLDPSLDVRARAPNGVDSDLSIRGGSFGQTLVLVERAAPERCADRPPQPRHSRSAVRPRAS